MKLLLMDLDDTLIDTSSFKKDIQKTLALLCKTEISTIELNYAATKTAYGNLLDDFFRKLSEEFGVSNEDIRSANLECIKRIKIKRNVLEYMRNFDGFKVIFTYGNQWVQENKIKLLDLEREAGKVMVLQGAKIRELDKIVDGQMVVIETQKYANVTLVDDNQKFLDEVMNKYPFIKIVNSDSIINGSLPLQG